MASDLMGMPSVEIYTAYGGYIVVIATEDWSRRHVCISIKHVNRLIRDELREIDKSRASEDVESQLKARKKSKAR